MNRHLDFNDYKKEVLKNPRVKAEYDRLQPEFTLINALIEARKNKGLTQAQLAQKIGTKQSAIARIESGNANPSIGFLQKLAEALGKKLVIQFK